MNHISVNQTIAPTSTLNVPGLFQVGIKAKLLTDLANASGVKLKDLIPEAALKVLVRNAANHTDIVWLEKPGGSATALLPQEGAELAVADMGTHSVYGDTDRGVIVVSYTRLMGDKE
jgi:hypothetical protein